jgi:hypothetical protein
VKLGSALWSRQYLIGLVHSNENYYAVIDSIESDPAGYEADAHAAKEGALASSDFDRSHGPQAVYFIRTQTESPDIPRFDSVALILW